MQLKSEDFMSLVFDIETIYEIEDKGLFKYSVGKFDTKEEATSYKKEIAKVYGLKGSKVTQYIGAK